MVWKNTTKVGFGRAQFTDKSKFVGLSGTSLSILYFKNLISKHLQILNFLFYPIFSLLSTFKKQQKLSSIYCANEYKLIEPFLNPIKSN